jgi:hypothetical protein
MKHLFGNSTIVVLLGLAAVSGLWFGQPLNVQVNGVSLPTWVPISLFIVSLLLTIGLAIERRVEAPAAGEITREVTRAPSKKFTVRQGKIYKATISLGFLEQMASNDMIADMLKKAGFANVKVTGDGSTRHAEAKWTTADASADLPSQIVSATEVADAGPPPASGPTVPPTTGATA